jgi:hypothetical protein
MRQGFQRVFLSALLMLATASVLSAMINVVPPQANVDQTVAITLIPYQSFFVIKSSIKWDFGDGTGASGAFSVNKAYLRPNTFSIRVEYTDGSGALHVEHASVTIYENRRIVFTPANPQVNQTVSFKALNFLSASIRWDFGDESPMEMGGVNITHSYSFPGSFEVKAYDLGGTSTIPISAVVPVAVDTSRRLIQAVPPNPVAGQPVTLTAIHFFTTNIRWDFGDGSPAEVGGVSALHTYAAAGMYLVQAWDWGGAYGGPTALSLTVQEASGPRSAFQIFFLQLRFEDGKAYKVVPRDAQGLTAFADIKYEGTGIFQAEWLVDGSPFRVVTRAMPFAEDITLDSSGVLPGQPAILPGFPANIPGLHEVSLRIFQPAVEFLVPVIRYFVSADSSVRPQDLAGARLELESARGAETVSARLEAGALQAEAGRYIILNGTLTYGSRRPPAALALLRVYLDDELVDQQFLWDLRPGQERRFATSIFNPSGQDRWVYLTVYDLDGNKAELILFQKLRLYSSEK